VAAYLRGQPAREVRGLSDVPRFASKCSSTELSRHFNFFVRADSAESFAAYEKERNDLKDKDAFKINPKVNLDVSRSFGENDRNNLWFGVQNIFSNYREYGYSTGSKKSFPDRIRWSDEPTSIHLKVTTKF
jgi:hypothetical protein